LAEDAKRGGRNLKVAKDPVSVSVLICVKNAEKHIGDCICSILNQTYTNFEIVVIEEFDSNDNTKNIIETFNDKRIQYFRNRRWLGLTKSRNLSVKYAKGVYIFFTDSDCVVSQDWIEQGLKSLRNKDCVGVEGKSYNVSEEYQPTFSDHIYKMNCGEFMTNNMAYKKSVVEYVGGFDERYSFHEDRDLALRIQRFGKITFNPNMKVYVQQETLTPKAFIKRSDALRNKVFLFKRFRERNFMMWRIAEPLSLAKILFPPIIFSSLVFKKFRKLDDFKLMPFMYIYVIRQRLLLWKECARERVFMI
jgi:glycosyltransferase involved in cell wall biosynthesis